jgi:lipopolysaccharide biosynthesis regulator YciM
MDASSEEIQERTLFQWLLLLGGMAVLLVAVGFGIVWGYGQAKLWRAHELTREAKDLLGRKETAEGESKLLAAYTLEPHDAEVLRTLAAHDLSLRDPHALGFYQLLLALPEATREDQREASRAFLSFGDLKSAEQLVQALIAKAPEAEDYALQAQIYWQAGGRTQAISFVKQALELEPKNRANQLLLAQMLLVMPDREQQEEALNLLREIAQANDQEGLTALEVMARIPRLDADSQRWVLERLRQHPLLDDDGRIAGWELEKRLGTRDANVVMKEAFEYFKSGDPAHKAMAAQWFSNQGQPELALELAPLPDAQGNKDLFLTRLNALASLKNWTEVQKELSDNAPLSQTLIFLYRARAEHELGNPAQSAADWDRARAAAGMEKEMLSELGRYAMQMGLYDEAKKTYAQMAHNPDQALEGYAALLQVEVQHGTNDEVLETLKQMMADLPAQPEPKNDWAYLNLLLNTNVDEAWNMAQSLVQANPQLLAYRTTLALGYLRKKDAAGAAGVYDGLQIDWSTATPSAKLIYAVVLAANGKKDQAAAFAHTLNRSQLRKEEWDLLNFYLPET